MKRLVILFVLIFSCFSVSAQQNDPWQIVIDSCRNGSYSEVYPLARSLFEKSLKNGDSQELLRSTVYLCGVDYCFRESPMDSAVYRLNAIMPLLMPVERDVARALLVREYQYFCHYGYVSNKIQSTDNPDSDYKYWGAKRCQDTIDALVDRILSDKEMLRSVAPERFAYVFDTVSFSNDGYAVREFTPTLYEMLLASVLEDVKQIKGETFGVDFNELLALEHAESRMIWLLGEWARGVERVGVESCLGFEVYRWGYLYRKAVSRYTENLSCVRALEREVRWFDSFGVESENLAVLYSLLADMWSNLGFPDSSMRCCNEVVTRWKGTEMADQCTQLLQEICKPWAKLYVETAPCSNASVPALVEYRNLDSLYFFRYWARKMNDSVLRTEPLQQWSVALPKHDDVHNHSALVPIPPIPQGRWFIVLSTTPNPLDGIWGYTLQESYDVLMLFSDTVVKGGYIVNGNVIVVDRMSGEPLEGVPVTNSYSVSPGKGAGGHLTATTDHRGVAFIDVTRIPNDSYTDCVFTTYKDYQCRKRRNRIWYTPHDDGEVSGSVVIDRPIYRQGDTVHFAFVTARFWGFLKAKPLKSKKYLVRLYRSRDEVLDSLWVVTDDWGEADGSFIIPSSAMSGDYVVSVSVADLEDEDWEDELVANFSVEPLRQPHFKIELSLADTLVYFDRPFTIKGRAIGYNGMPVADAEVRFASEELELDEWSEANKIKTDSLGNFSISMGPVKNNGSDYQIVVVNVWVTDPSGETHQDLFSFGIKEKPVELQFVKENQLYSQSFQYPTLQFNIWPVRCTDSRGIPLRMDLGCRLSRLRKPDILLPSPFSHKRSYEQSLSQEEFSKLFPNYAYDPQCGDYTLWEVDSVIYDLSLATDSNGRLQLPVPENLPSGVYKVEVDHPLSDGLEDFIVYHQPHETKPQTPDMLYCEASPSFVEVGDSIRLRLSTPLPQLRVVVEVSENNIDDLEHSEIHWITLSNEVKEFSFPVNERMLGKTIGIKVYAIQHLASFSRAFSFIVQPHHQLKLDISTFRDHIQSGTQQRWKLGVKDEQDRGQSARMILTMFDKSLYESLSYYASHCPYCYRTLFPDSFAPQFLNIDPFGCSENSYSDWRVNVSAQTPSRNLPSFDVSTPNYFTLALLQNIIPVSLKDGVWCSNSNLHGVLTDQKTGEPLPFVNIVLKQDGLTIIGTQTDFDGIYSFRNLPVGSYEMEIAYIGYAKMICKVQIGKDGSSLAFNHQLMPTATNLEEVMIVEYKVPIIDIGSPENGMRMSSDDIVALISSKSSGQNPAKLHLRQNLSSLAFFRPDIVSNRKGKATLEFTAPDRLTEWDVFGVAWTKDMKVGSFNFSTVTSNPLMVQPLVPRFLRQGDTIDFAVKLSNASDSLREAQMTIELQGRVGEKDSVFFLQSRSGLRLEANASQTLKFRIPVPKDLQTARYKVTAQSPDANDGEQDFIPVLPNKELVTQSLAIYLNGKGEKHFTLTAPNSQFSIVNSQFTLTPNPLWLALASMPYLQELKNPSTLYLANTLAADLMSQSVFKTYPQLREKIAEALKTESSISQFPSPYSQINKSTNQQLFSNPEAIETRIDENLDKLVYSHNPDGGWSWMPEQGESSVYVTRSILETLHIPINNSTNQQLNSSTVCNALRYIDGQMEMLHRDTLAPQLNNSTTQQLNIIDYLYLRSIYPFNDTLSHPAFHDWYALLKNELPLYNLQSTLYNLHSSARLAQIFYLNGDTAIAQELVRRLKQRSLLSEEMGMYWRDNLGGCYYYQRPIETQALLIETFALVTPQDTESVALMQQWLLKQKQTTHWGSDMATLAAIKALLIPSALNSQLNNSTTRQLNNPSTTLKAGPYTLVAKDSFAPVTRTFDHFTPDMGEITLSKSEPGIVWGAAYLQYFAPLDSIPYNEMGIKLKKELYIVQPDGSLRMAKQFKVGDKVRVRILIDCDRTLEYLELKDQRSGAFEPCRTRSGWEWNDGLRYYVSVENSSTSCYIDRLNKGQYLVEYDLWVNASGSFTEGIATMQCLYAPEFRSNTPGSRIQVIEN